MTSYRYGASFVDHSTGLRFEMHHPASRPDRWHQYLEGANREYERYGLGSLVVPEELERGDGVSLFFVGVDEGDRVVAGLRCYGPLDDAAAAQALKEMHASPEWEEHRSVLEGVTPYGVVEMKGAWRETSGAGDHRVNAPMVRCCVHAIEWLGAEVLLAAVADRMEPIMKSVGSIMMGVEASAYPSETYRTILTRLRRARYRDLITDEQAHLLRVDAEQLRRGPAPQSTTGWRPIILDVAHRADRQILANLRADPAVEFTDAVAHQREELAHLRPAPDPTLAEEPPVHVYYPWRRMVARMLGPRAFAAVRLDRNRNRITREEQERLRRQHVGIVGLSSGHAIAIALALEGLCGDLELADFDGMELTNLNRMAASVLDLGLNKAVLAARNVAEIDPYMQVRVAERGLHPDNVDEFVAGLDVLVEQSDDLAMKLLVREVARRQHVTVLMGTSDRGLLDVERFDLDPDRPILHGLLGDASAASVGTLSIEEKIPHVVAVVDAAHASARAVASTIEIGRTLTTWPQLATETILGGALVASAVRRLGLGDPLPSGRSRTDLDSLLAELGQPHSTAPALTTAAPVRPALTPQPPSDPVLAVVHAATMAPSGGNSQPWRFELASESLAFLLDSSRTTSMDVRSRASYVAIGAAVFNARVAAARAGRLGPVALFPEGAGSPVVATLALQDERDPELAERYDAMLARCSNRRHGTPQSLDLALTARLAHAASEDGASLRLVTDGARMAECADILGEAERARFLSAHLHSELIEELRWPGEDVRTGIDIRTLDLSPAEITALGLARRPDVMALLGSWDAGHALGTHVRVAVRSSSALAVVTVPNATPAAYVAGGMAAERVWVEAQSAGLGVQAVVPPFLFAVQGADFEMLGRERWGAPLRSLADRFREVVGAGPATAFALVLRLSHTSAPSARSARLPLDAVLCRRGTMSAA